MKFSKSILLFLLLLTACTGMEYPTQSVDMQALPSATPQPTLTETSIPTPTVGYEATALSAQQTLEVANLQVAAMTADYEERIQQQIAWTAEADARAHEISAWTATAALTSIPATETQQAVLNTQIPVQQALLAAQITSTAEAPALRIAMTNAENYAKYGGLRELAEIVALFGLGIGLILMGIFLARQPQWKKNPPQAGTKSTVEDEAPPVFIQPIADRPTVVTIKTDNGGGYESLQRVVVPCTADQLTMFAEDVLNGAKTLAFAYWEKKGRLGRPVFSALRNFLQAQQFAKAGSGAGSLVLTDVGESFLRGWLESRALPHLYEFTPESRDFEAKTAHERENHDRETGLSSYISDPTVA